jgi:hypothetical protein
MSSFRSTPSCSVCSPTRVPSGSSSTSRCWSPTSSRMRRRWPNAPTQRWAAHRSGRPSWSPATSARSTPRSPRWRERRSRPSASTWWPVVSRPWPRSPSWPPRRWRPGSSTVATSGTPTWRRRWAGWPGCWVPRVRWRCRRRARRCTCPTRWTPKPTSTTGCAAGWRSVRRRSPRWSHWRRPCATGATRSPRRSRRRTTPSRRGKRIRGCATSRFVPASRPSPRRGRTAGRPRRVARANRPG